MVRALLRTVAAFLALAGPSTGASSHSKAAGLSADALVAQLGDTLKNLLRSLDDAEHDSEKVFSARQHWCSSMLVAVEHNLTRTDRSLATLRADVEEYKASAQEAGDIAKQLQADLELVKHTVDQTEAMIEVRRHAAGDAKLQSDEKLLAALLDNKRQSQDSLQAQLEVALPRFAQLQASVATASHRFGARGDSSKAGHSTLASLRSFCKLSQERAEAFGDAHSAEVRAVDAALEALEQLRTTSATSSASQASPTPDAEEHPAAQDSSTDPMTLVIDLPTEVGFLQVRSNREGVTSEELLGIFGSSRAWHGRHQRHRGRLGKGTKRGVLATTGSIEKLMAQLQEMQGDDVHRQEWCQRQRQGVEVTAKVAKDAVARTAAEMDAHADAEAELGSDLAQLQASLAVLESAAQDVANSTKREQALIAGRQHDHQLASKILAQMATVLQDFSAAAETAGMNQQKQKTATILSQIVAAQKVVESDMSASGKLKRGMVDSSDALTRDLGDVVHALAREVQGVELARDEHLSQRLRVVDEQQMYQAEVDEAQLYLQKLAEGCGETAFEALQRDGHDKQLRALTDARQVLEGKSLVGSRAKTDGDVDETGADKADAVGLRGSASGTTARPLTPMERAAAEMGVEVDE